MHSGESTIHRSVTLHTGESPRTWVNNQVCMLQCSNTVLHCQANLERLHVVMSVQAAISGSNLQDIALHAGAVF